MKKSLLWISIITTFLASTGFVYADALGAITESASTLGVIFGMFTGLPFLFNALWVVSKEKDQGPTSMFDKSFMKYFIPIIAVIFIIGAIMNIDVSGAFLSGFGGTLAGFVILGIIIRMGMRHVEGKEHQIKDSYNVKEEHTDDEMDEYEEKLKERVETVEKLINEYEKAPDDKKTEARDKVVAELARMKEMRDQAKEELGRRFVKRVNTFIEKAEKKIYRS